VGCQNTSFVGNQEDVSRYCQAVAEVTFHSELGVFDVQVVIKQPCNVSEIDHKQLAVVCH